MNAAFRSLVLMLTVLAPLAPLGWSSASAQESRSSMLIQPALSPAEPASQTKGGSSPAPKPRNLSKSAIDDSITLGLCWLARHQNPDGSWSAMSFKARCSAEAPCHDVNETYHEFYDEGLTSLATLAFLDAGYGPESKKKLADPVAGKQHDAGAVVTKALEWLCKRQQPNGQFTDDRAYLYNEALATMALAETLRMTKNSRWKAPAQQGVEFIQRAQRPSPIGPTLWGWRYEPRDVVERDNKGDPSEAAAKLLFEADTSVTTWCVRALSTAKLAGLRVDPQCTAGALAYIKWVTADDGRVGYMDARAAGATVTGKNDQFQYHSAVMAALGIESRMLIGVDPKDPFLEMGARQVVIDLPSVSEDKLTIDYYYWHCGSLALNDFDGRKSGHKGEKLWGPWKQSVGEALLAVQNVEERSCHRGGWITLDRWAYTGGPIYTTAINVMTLALLD